MWSHSLSQARPGTPKRPKSCLSSAHQEGTVVPQAHEELIPVAFWVRLALSLQQQEVRCRHVSSYKSSERPVKGAAEGRSVRPRPPKTELRFPVGRQPGPTRLGTLHRPRCGTLSSRECATAAGKAAANSFGASTRGHSFETILRENLLRRGGAYTEAVQHLRCQLHFVSARERVTPSE